MSEQIDVSGPMYRTSRTDEQSLDKGTMRLLYLAGFGGLAIMAGIAAYSLSRHSGGEAVPVVQAVSGPVRVKPENPGGMTVAPEQVRVDPSQSHLAPGTEEPNPRALLIPPDVRVGVPPAPPRAKPVIVMLSSARSEAEAQAAWDRLAKRLPDLTATHRPLFQKTNETGPTPWRLRAGGFVDPAQAKAFCDKVKTKGGQCTVVES